MRIMSLSVIVIGLGFASQVMADRPSNNHDSIDIYANWIRATDEELAQQRGGFVLPNGMTLAISIEKMIFLNGVETFSSLIKFPEHDTLVQNGNQNVAPDMISSALGTVIQNSLDEQAIKVINEIGIEIGNLQNMGSYTNKSRIDFIMPNMQ